MNSFFSCLLFVIVFISPANAAPPTSDIVQAAYERERGRGDLRHDKNLKVLSVECAQGKIDKEYLCWITYTSTSDPAKPLFFNVAAIAETHEGWTLRSGLCRR
jgi:hypothetical protein